MANVGDKKVFVAMSGGVDSSVAALILKNTGYDITGVFMKNWSDPAWPCPWREDRQDALRVCVKLGVPFETWDFTKEYKQKVVDYMVREYAAGRTPNPDVMCNKEIKFGLFFDQAMARGADYIATGHYVRREPEFPIINYQFSKRTKSIENLDIENSLKIESCKLKIAKDRNKDQSYFLWTLKQEQIVRCLFPIGEIESKAEVRKIAAEYGLPTAAKKDSQGICFMGPVKVEEFIRPFVKSEPGDIVTAAGVKIGRHWGLDFYTIGQRKGIGVGGTGPYYVASKKYETNTLVVAPAADQTVLESDSLTAGDINFISPSSEIPIGISLRIQAAVRYRQEPVPAKLEYLSSGQWLVTFDRPVRAITPGQSVVFYSGEELLGGGIIG